MRIIPKTAKVKVEFFKNFSLVDTLLVLVGLGLEILIFLTNIGFWRFVVMAVVLCIFIGLFLNYDGQRFYMFFVNSVKYVFSIKRYSLEYEKASTNIEFFIPFKDIKNNSIIYQDYVAKVLQIDPREFRLLSEYRQDEIIDSYFGKVLRSISGHTKASLVKIDRKLTFKQYVQSEEEKKDELKKLFEAGSISQEELFARNRIIEDRIQVYNNLEETLTVKKPYYYFVVYDSDVGVIDEILENAKSSFLDAGMTSKILDDKQLAVFLKYNYCTDFDEKDIDFLSKDEVLKWIIPKDIKFTPFSTYIDGVETFNFTVKNFPLSVMNAWGYQMFNIPGTKVVMNIEPYEKYKAIRMLDRSLQELSSQSEQAQKVSSMIDKQTHINTLVNLLRMLQNDNEVLFKVTLHFVLYNTESNAKEKRNNLKKRIKRIMAEDGFELADNFCKQNRAMISNNLSRLDVMDEFARSIHSGSVAASFPFVLSSVMDERGIVLGTSNGYPIIVDFFKRNDERVNSNMVIMGKSGSGKSYSTKTMLSHLAAENCKIFILDPENEYLELAKNLHGRLIDVGTATQGRINPFQIITTLDADEDEGISDGAVDNFSVHLQFLEEFFRVILQGIDSQSLEYLNNLILEMYKKHGITNATNFSELKPEDYPIFDDLYELIESKLKKAKVDYDITNLRVLNNYISKFARDGRNAKLWNGPSTLSVKENFTVFNFQSLLANKNGVVANAQMLLVLKWLDNEIIKNREFNIKHGTKRKIIVAIDEAHVFIDPKYPVALDFMYQLAKRIRKYNGMQIVITQNIKDFVGSEDIIRKSTAIINACQYSFIFSLAPNDMDDLCTLYDKAGQINKVEQEQIVGNARGNAFIIMSPTSRTNIKIVASKRIKTIFGE